MIPRTLTRLALSALAATVGLALGPAPASGRDASDSASGDDEILVIGHRGASGHRPEHTLAAYELAIDMGADFIEPDLVPTKDGRLVARHENEISGTTDIATRPEFAARRTTKVIDGVPVTGWFTEDLTLAELRTLRAIERIPEIRPGNTAYDGRFRVPTIEEVIALAKRKSRELGRTIGIYPETKHPSYFDALGLSMEEPLVEVLHRHGYRDQDDPVFIQSFEVSNLQDLRDMTDVRLVQLLNSGGTPYDFTLRRDPRTYADLVTPEGLAGIALYADGVGVNKNLIIPRDPDGTLGQPTDLVDDAHALGLVVHGWTFRLENTFLPAEHRRGSGDAAPGDLVGELQVFLATGMDGFFADHPGHGVAAVSVFEAAPPAAPAPPTTTPATGTAAA